MSEPEYSDDAWCWTETVDGVELQMYRYDDGHLRAIPPDDRNLGYAWTGMLGWPEVWIRGGRHRYEQHAARKVAREYLKRANRTPKDCPKVFG